MPIIDAVAAARMGSSTGLEALRRRACRAEQVVTRTMGAPVIVRSVYDLCRRRALPQRNWDGVHPTTRHKIVPFRPNRGIRPKISGIKADPKRRFLLAVCDSDDDMRTLYVMDMDNGKCLSQYPSDLRLSSLGYEAGLAVLCGPTQSHVMRNGVQGLERGHFAHTASVSYRGSRASNLAYGYTVCRK